MWFKYIDDVYCSKEKLTSNRLWNPIMLLLSVAWALGLCVRDARPILVAMVLIIAQTWQSSAHRIWCFEQRC